MTQLVFFVRKILRREVYMGDYAEYNLYCATEAAQKTFFSTSVPTECPTNPAHTIVPDSLYISRSNIPGQTYYEQTQDTLSGPTIVGLLPDSKVSKGFGLPPKFMFEDKSAAFAASAMVGSQLVICWTAPMSTPTANNGFVVSASCTTSPNNVTYGSPVCFTGTSAIASTSIAICALSSTDFIIVYRGTSNQAYYVFGAVSGSTITVSSPSVINATSTGDQISSIWVGLVGTSIVIAYRDAGNSNRGYWVASTTINLGILRIATWGLKGIFNNATTASSQYSLCGCVIDSSRFAIFFDNQGTSIRAMIGTVSGLLITAGTLSGALDSANVVAGSNMAMINMGSISGNVVLGLFYRRSIDNVSTGSLVVGTCSSSGTAAGSQTVTFGSPTSYTNGPGVQGPSAVCLSPIGGADGSFAVAYVDASNSNAGKITTGVISTSGAITIKQTDFLYNTASFYTSLALLSGTTCAVVYRDMLYFNTGVVSMFTVTGSELIVDFSETKSRTPFGIACEAATAGDVVEVCVSNPTCLSGLTPATTYYAHGDGSYSTSNVAINNLYTPVKMGFATSSTGMILSL